MLSLRVTEDQLKELRTALAQGRPTAAGARSRRPTAPSCWISRRWSTCASSPTSTASASSVLAEPPRPRKRARPGDLPVRPRHRAHARDRALGAVATRAWASTARCGSRPERSERRWTPAAGGAGRTRPHASAARTCISTSIKMAVGRQPAGGRGPAAPDGDADRPLFPLLARDLELRRRARVRPPAAAGRAVRRRGRDGRVASLPGRPLPVRCRGRRALGTAIGSLGR